MGIHSKMLPGHGFAVLVMLLCTLAFTCVQAYMNVTVAFAADDSASGTPGQASSQQRTEDPQPADDPFQDAVAVELEDGKYRIDVAIEGGSGRANVRSPAELEVRSGKGAITLVWSSKYYDYMLVGGKKYLPVNAKGNSMFTVPVLAYDEPFPVVGDTTAMSEAHEVDYMLTVKRESAQAQPADEPSEAPSDSASASASDSSGTAPAASDEAASIASSSGESAPAASNAPSGSGSSASTAASAQSSGELSGSGSSTDNARAESQAQQGSQAQSGAIPWPWVVFIVCAVLSAVAIGFTIGLLRNYRSGVDK